MDLNVYIGNKKVLGKIIEAPQAATERHGEDIRVDLSAYAGREVQIRLFQRVLLPGKTAGNAYWKYLECR